MKQVMIVAMVCINVALVLALVFSLNEPVANAQFRGNADYMVVPAHVNDTVEAVYVFDIGQQKLLAFQPNPNNKMRLETYQGKIVKNDFAGERD